MSIPRLLFQAWCGPKPMPDRERKWCEQMRAMNPTWEHRLGGNELLERYGQDPYVKALIDQKEPWAFVVDRVRVLLLREHGGVWLDPDCQPIRPLDSIPIWDQSHVHFAAAMRSPHRKDVALHRAVPIVDNTFIATTPNSYLIRRLESLWTPQAPVVNGHRIGIAIIEGADYSTVLLNHRFIYAEQQYPETVVLHDGHNLGSWTLTAKQRHG